MSRRVVVTGLGVVTPVGVGLEESWSALLGGESGFRPVESFDTSRHSVQVGAEVRGFRPDEHLRTLDPGSLGRASQLAVVAARMAAADAGIEETLPDPHRAGVAMGTTSGEPCEVERLTDSMLAGEPSRVGGEFISRYPCHRITEHVVVQFNAKTRFRSINAKSVLDRVNALDISTWAFKSDMATRHIGPMAQDWNAIMGWGSSPTSINQTDVNGVLLASIQALSAQNAALANQNADLESRLAHLEAQLAALLAAMGS